MGNQHDPETHSLDLTPLKDLVNGRNSGEVLLDVPPTQGRRPSRGYSTDSYTKSKLASRRGPSRIQVEAGAATGYPVLNTSSTQKYALETRSRTDLPVLEIIGLRFPTFEDPHFTVSFISTSSGGPAY